MSDIRMNEIRAREAAASPGHWGTAYDGAGTYAIEAQPRFVPGSGAVSVNEGVVATLVGEHGDEQTYANASFIASAREDVTYLLNHVAELRAELADRAQENRELRPVGLPQTPGRIRAREEEGVVMANTANSPANNPPRGECRQCWYHASREAHAHLGPREDCPECVAHMGGRCPDNMIVR